MDDENDKRARGHRQAEREAALGNEFFTNMISTVVRMAKARKEMNDGVEALRSFARDKHDGGGSATRHRVGNMSFDIAEIGMHGWRDLLTLQKRYEPELLSSWLTPGLAWMDPTAELVSDTKMARVDAKKGVGADAWVGKVTLTLENRSRAYVEILVPPTLLLVRADDLDRVLVEVGATPAAPVLGPGDQLPLEVSFTVVGAGASETPPRYLGALELRTRGALRLSFPIELTLARS